MNNEELQTIAQRVGTNHGYEEITAEFSPARDFKVKWQRSYRWINMEVSDYLQHAPEAVMESLINSIFEKIRGDEGGYAREVTDYLQSAEFLSDNQPVYVNRIRISPDNRLNASYARLVSKGLLPSDDRVVFGTSPWKCGLKAVQGSLIMKTVVVNTALLDMDDEEALDFAIYSAVRFIEQEFPAHNTSVESLATTYPGFRAIQNRIEEAGLRI